MWRARVCVTRTPLTSVLGFAKIIKKRLDDRIFPLVPTDDKKVAQTVQQVQENQDKNFSYLALYRVADKKFLRLADEGMTVVENLVLVNRGEEAFDALCALSSGLPIAPLSVLTHEGAAWPAGRK